MTLKKLKCCKTYFWSVCSTNAICSIRSYIIPGARSEFCYSARKSAGSGAIDCFVCASIVIVINNAVANKKILCFMFNFFIKLLKKESGQIINGNYL